MPFENPEPGRYWGYHCIRCGKPIAISVYQEGFNRWQGDEFTLDCMDRDCGFQAVYPLADIRILEITDQL